MFSMFKRKPQYLEVLESSFGLPVDDDSSWWVKNPARAYLEITRMDENSNAILIEDLGQLHWIEDITNNFGTTFQILIKAMDNHPFSAPQAYVIEPDISRAPHRYKDGSLCLFRPEEYSNKMTILSIRNLACAWCFAYEAYQNTGEWPAAEAPH